MTSDRSMITIDGAKGEGGGQILRSSLALSMATGRPFRMVNIRAGREKPGLMRQHLTCVQAAAAICSGKVEGASVGAKDISFIPGRIVPDSYHFPIGTAGSCTMVLQAILPALLIANGPSSVTIEGGTHNSKAPPFEFFERALLPLLARAGARVRARCERLGFYPAGGGRIVVDVEPTGERRYLEVLSRGNRTHSRAWAHVSRLPASIAKRELDVVIERLGIAETDTQVVGVKDPIGPGNAVVVELGYEHVSEVFFAVGEIGKSAELVAREASDEARDYIAGERPIGPHLADQLMVPLALLDGGRFLTGALTDHSMTNVATMEAFGGSVVVGPDGFVEIARLAR
ncbi:MAG: RNA 3'-terminal phosphate cyclase [Phycisphaerales bacterium]|nr:RNA 3'-terminal phosphate cyclase [Phycisphaerales bacterium]